MKSASGTRPYPLITGILLTNNKQLECGPLRACTWLAVLGRSRQQILLETDFKWNRIDNEAMRRLHG
jgi:hypothetical protein